MKKLFKLGLVLFGFVLASVASTDIANAINQKHDVEVSVGGCQGSGACGTTANGTKLYGKWAE